MRMLIQNQITGVPKLADINIDGLKIHVKLVNEPVEFTCQSSKCINANDLIILTDNFRIPFGMRKFRILTSSEPNYRTAHDRMLDDTIDGLEYFFGGIQNVPNA